MISQDQTTAQKDKEKIYNSNVKPTEFPFRILCGTLLYKQRPVY